MLRIQKQNRDGKEKDAEVEEEEKLEEKNQREVIIETK